MPDFLPCSAAIHRRLIVDFVEATRQAFEAADGSHDYLIRMRRSGRWFIERYDLDGVYTGSLVCYFTARRQPGPVGGTAI